MLNTRVGNRLGLLRMKTVSEVIEQMVTCSSAICLLVGHARMSFAIGYNLLFHQLFIERHGFDMGEHPMPRFQSQSFKRFFRDAGDERRSDIQEHIH